MSVCVLESAVDAQWHLFVIQEILNPLVTYHRFISFSLYVAGLCGFVFSLRKKNYLKQFTMVHASQFFIFVFHLIFKNFLLTNVVVINFKTDSCLTTFFPGQPG